MKKIFSWTDIKTFKRIITVCDEILKDVDPAIFSSPYSVIPIISQILGLNTPLMGTGDCPFSLMSIASKINKSAYLKEAFELPMLQKRVFIDEIYDAVCPILLEEEEVFIDFLIDVKFKEVLSGQNEQVIQSFRKDYKEKIAFLKNFLKNFQGRDGDFAHLIHYGHMSDLYREFDFLRNQTEDFISEWSKRSYPVVIEIIIRGFRKKGDSESRDLRGWVVIVSNHTQQLLLSRKLRKKKIYQAALLAKKLGARIIGMGGLVASFMGGGKDLSREVRGVGFSTGHAYTIANIIRILEGCSKDVGVNLRHSKIAIVGAAGSIGSGCAKLVLEKRPQEILLIESPSFIDYEKLERIKCELIKIDPLIKIRISRKLSDMKIADLIIVATNSPHALIKECQLKVGAIVIDDSFPKNISQKMLRARNDVIFLEGGITKMPLSIDFNFARNMPDLMDLPITRAVSCKEIYSCFAEVLILALERYYGNYGLGDADCNLAKEIILKGEKYGFAMAPLQCFDQKIETNRLKDFSVRYSSKRQN